MNKHYLVATFEGDSPRNLDDNINRVLRKDNQIQALNISLSTYLLEGDLVYVATLLYMYEQ